MPIRRVQQQSDRGSIKDIQNGDDDKYPPTSQELRLRDLHAHALVTRDEALLNSLGLIAINGAPKGPISIYRHREYIKSLSEKLASQIEQTAKEIEGCLEMDESSIPQEMKWSRYKQAHSQQIITQENDFVKVANADGTTSTRNIRRSFRRVNQ